MQVEEGGSGVNEYQSNQQSYVRSFFNDVDITTCVHLRANAIARVPLFVYEPLPNGKRHKIDHDALDVLHLTNPKNWFAGKNWHRWNLGSLDISGHTCSQFAFDRRGIPSEIFWLPPVSYTPKLGPDGYFGGIEIREPGGHEYPVPADQLFYMSTGSLTGDIAGMSRIQAMRMDLNLTSYSKSSNYWFFRNNQRPDWLLMGDFAPTDDNTERLRRLINRWAGGDNRRGPLILGGGNLKATLLTTERKDMEWLSQQRISQEAKAAAFGVPVFLLNNLDRATWANYREANQAWWHNSLIPELDHYADQLTRGFLYRWPDAQSRKLKMGFDYAQVEGLGEDLAQIWEREVELLKTLTQGMQMGGLIPNQWRVIAHDTLNRLGVDAVPLEGAVPQGEDRLVNWNLVPSSQAGATLAIDMMAARGPNAALVQNVPNDPTDFEGAAEEIRQDEQAVADRRAEQEQAQTARQQTQAERERQQQADQTQRLEARLARLETKDEATDLSTALGLLVEAVEDELAAA